MEGSTSVLEISNGGSTRRLEWNGNVDDRAAAKAAFESAGQYAFASVLDAPGQSTQVRTWDEVEQLEKERGTVQVRIHPGLAGG